VAPSANTVMSEAELVVELFGLLGRATIIDEDQIDIATAVSGSGPAYFALFVEELAKSGIEAGLSEEVARLLARQTIIGTGRYLDESDITPEDLRAAVTSPNGTTEAAILSFEEQGFGNVIKTAFDACLRRAKELA